MCRSEINMINVKIKLIFKEMIWLGSMRPMLNSGLLKADADEYDDDLLPYVHPKLGERKLCLAFCTLPVSYHVCKFIEIIKYFL